MDHLIAQGPIANEVKLKMKHRDATRQTLEDGKPALHQIESEDAILSNKYRLTSNQYKQSLQERDDLQQQIDNLTSEIKQTCDINEALDEEVSSNIETSKRECALQQDKILQLEKLKNQLEHKENESRLVKHSLNEVIDKNAFNLKDKEVLKSKVSSLQNKKRALVFLNS